MRRQHQNQEQQLSRNCHLILQTVRTTVLSVTTDEDLEIWSSLVISRCEEETNPNEDVDEADGAADCEASIQTETAIKGDEYAAESF